MGSLAASVFLIFSSVSSSVSRDFRFKPALGERHDSGVRDGGKVGKNFVLATLNF